MDLKSYIDSRNLDQAEFAQMLSRYRYVSKTTIGNYISGKRLPCLEIGHAIVLITKGKVTHDDLITYWKQKQQERKLAENLRRLADDRRQLDLFQK